MTYNDYSTHYTSLSFVYFWVYYKRVIYADDLGTCNLPKILREKERKIFLLKRQVSYYTILSLRRPAITHNDADIVTTSCSLRPAAILSVTNRRESQAVVTFWTCSIISERLRFTPGKHNLECIVRGWTQGFRFQTNETIFCDYPLFHIVSILIRRTTKTVKCDACRRSERPSIKRLP